MYFDAGPSTLTANVGSAGTTGPAQDDPLSFQPEDDANVGGDPNSNDSNGNDGNQGGASNGNDPQGPDPDRDYLDKLEFSYEVRGGQLSTWGISGRIRATDVVYLVGRESDMSIESVRRLLQPDIVD